MKAIFSTHRTAKAHKPEIFFGGNEMRGPKRVKGAIFASRLTADKGARIVKGDGEESGAGKTLKLAEGLQAGAAGQLAEATVPKARQNAAERAYKTLRRAILTLELAPGSVLSRAGLAQRHGISQTPLREALLRLEQDGLIEVFAQARTVVARIDLRALFAVQFERTALEVEVVRRLVGRPNAQGVVRASDIFAQQEQVWQTVTASGVHALNEHIALEMLHLDRAYHAALFEGVGMERVFDRLAHRLGPLDRCQALQPLSAEQHQADLRFHGDILARIKARDPVGAEGAMRAHLAGGLGEITNLSKRYPNYFK